MKIALISTQGGHLTELLQVLEAFEGREKFFVTHHSIRDEDIQSIAPVYFCPNIGQRPHILLWSMVWSLWVLFREKPDVIFSTGSEIALPFIFWGRLFGLKSIFLESWARVSQPSLTGKIAYYLVDEFLVQWPQLAVTCGPKAKYFGAVV